MNFTITIAREYGSGGRYIAKKVAEELNIPFYDKTLLLEEAKKNGISVDELERFDSDNGAFYFPTMNNDYGTDLELSQHSYMATLKMIQLIASNESSVIVGRCADYILSDDSESVLKVFIYAPNKSKIERAVTHYGLTKKQAEAAVVKYNKKRKKYYEFISEKTWGDPMEYDILINSDVGIEAAAAAIVEAAKKKFKL